MADVSALVEEIKRLAVSAVDAGKPCGVFFGTVKSEDPLEIAVEQKLTLGEGQLILPRRLTDHEAEVEPDWETELQWQDVTGKEHLHEIKGRKKIKVYGGLKTGERVALLRLEGGQSFLVLDRVGD